MHFYIVTPSFNQIDFLKLCIASVRDQVANMSDAVDRCSVMVDKDSLTTQQPNNSITSYAICVHHHIQDGGSTDGTVEWLADCVAHQSSTDSYQLTFTSEADEGMYDAINKGWMQAPDDADVIAHLNCDEQYLPGALGIVADYFSKHWKTDVALADMIVVDNEGAYVCHRRSIRPNRILSRICCFGMTTTTFQRVSVVRDKQVLFDPSWRNIGDMVWYNSLYKAGVRFGVLNQLVAVFTDTGENLNLTEEALRERKRYADEYLFGLRFITRMVSKFYSLRRWLKEFYLNAPTEYALYWNDLSQRDIRKITKPTGLWHRSNPRVGK